MTLKVKHIQSFLQLESCQKLHEWILNLWGSKNLTLWSNNNYIGGYRFHNPEDKMWGADEYNRTLKPLIDLPTEFFETRNRIATELGFSNELFRPNATALAGVMFKDGYVEPHVDSTVDGYVHWRANVLLKCDDGGDPVIDGCTYKLNAGDLIVFPADVLEHYTTIQKSDEPRTIISYPFLIPHCPDII